MPFLSRLMEKASARGTAYTALDAMKLFAIINMTADHIGDYFFPDDLWWRAIGRITFPVWFFLVGYSRTRAIGRTIYVYAAILVLDHLFIGLPLFPFNALVSILLCKWVLNLCEDRHWLPQRLPELICGFIVLTVFTTPFFEYGSIAFLFALFGRMVVQKEKKHFLALTVASYVTFIVWQIAIFPFNYIQLLYVLIGTAWVVLWLSRCPNDVIWENWRVSRFKTFIAVLSRNTMPYYFYHRLIFEILFAFILGKGIGFTLRWFD